MKYLIELLAPFQSTVLGTLGSNGYPFSSYAPFYYDGEVIYIFISDIATHSKNMQAIPKASAFFVEDESMTDNIFKRKRISLQCNVVRIGRKEKRFNSIMESFKTRFEDETLPMLMGECRILISMH